MVNKVAALGALVCIVAAALSTGLLLTDEFVEVFVALGNGETSCAIGFLGVNEAGFDASCLSVEELEASSLGGVDPDGNKVFSIEAFTAPTEEFKLLFPTQEGFFEEINPFFARLQACIAANDPLCPPEILRSAFPEFTGDCDAYYTALGPAQVGTFLTGQVEINALLAQLFGEVPVQTIVGAFYDRTAYGGLITVLANTVEAIAGVLSGAISDLAGNFEEFTGAEAGAYLNAFVDNLNLALTGSETPLIINMAGRMAAQASTAAGAGLCETLDLSTCFLGLLDGTSDLPNVTGANYATFSYSATFCEIVTNSSSCTFENLSPAASFALLELIDDTSDEATLALLTSLLGAWNGAGQIATLGLNGAVLIFNDDGDQIPSPITTPDVGAFLASASTEDYVSLISGYLSDATTNFTYPSSKDDAFEYCTFLQAIGLYGNLNQTTCSFEFFVEKAADAAFAGGLDESTISLAVSLTTLFGTCFDFIDGVGSFTDPNLCWVFFPASLLNLAFSGGLQADLVKFQVQPGFVGSGSETFTAAAEACNDDIADLEAIESAQAISPVGIVFLGAAAVFAVVSVAVNNKVIAGVAGGVSLLGTLLILIALITVYNAPIYASVGDSDDATRGDIIYLAGQTVSLGLGAIAMGAIGGVIMIVSVFTFSASDSAEAKALGAAAEKPVSI